MTSMVMNEKSLCEVCNIEVNSAFIDKHEKTKNHIRTLENDILILTIKNGTNKSKEEWLNDFKTLGINVPQYVIDYDYSKPSRQMKYYEKNKEEINKDNRERFVCACGKEIAKHSKAKHLKSTYHKKRV